MEKEFEKALEYLLKKTANLEEAAEGSADAMRYTQAVNNLVCARDNYLYTNHRKERNWNPNY